MRDARFAAAHFGACSIVGAFAAGQERFPGDASGIVDPGFFRLGVAAGRGADFENLAVRLPQPVLDFRKLLTHQSFPYFNEYCNIVALSRIISMIVELILPERP
jgi:hypothetical protein